MQSGAICPGTRLMVPKWFGLIEHHFTFVGAVGSHGENVVDNTPNKGVHLDYFENAIDARACKVVAVPEHPSTQTGIVRRALSQVGLCWDPIANNCEHTASYAQSGIRISKQLRFAIAVLLVVAVLFGIAWFLLRRRG